MPSSPKRRRNSTVRAIPELRPHNNKADKAAPEHTTGMVRCSGRRSDKSPMTTRPTAELTRAVSNAYGSDKGLLTIDDSHKNDSHRIVESELSCV